VHSLLQLKRDANSTTLFFGTNLDEAEWKLTERERKIDNSFCVCSCYFTLLLSFFIHSSAHIFMVVVFIPHNFFFVPFIDTMEQDIRFRNKREFHPQA
jgi:hypothetical protein